MSCQTGNGGEPIAQERWEFFAQVWIAPYQRVVPDWTYVGVSGDKVVGYLTGCPNTGKFRRRKFFLCDLPHIVRIGARLMTATRDERSYLRRVVGLARGPEELFPGSLQHLLEREYPAHLHVNVESGFRQQGIGRQLLTNYLADLHQARISGVHLHCGARPLEFYRRMGFHELGHVGYGGVDVYALGLRF